MDPLTNLQVAVKNNVDVFYFSCMVPYNVLFAEDGQMGMMNLDKFLLDKIVKLNIITGKYSSVAFV